MCREEVHPLPVTRLVEFTRHYGEDWDGVVDLPPDVKGAIVKPVFFVSEEKRPLLERNDFSRQLLANGAAHVKKPQVHVMRRKVLRDARHDVDLPLEDSIRIFAEEFKVRAVGIKVKFALALAREADAGAAE